MSGAPDETLAQLRERTKFLKGTEVAALLNISKRQAYRLMKRGEIRTVQISQGCVRVRPQDLEAFIVANLSEPPSELLERATGGCR